MPALTLILWDVDHTLIETRGVGAELFRQAFEQATGVPLEHAPDVTGRTEPAIFRQTAELHSIPVTDQLVTRYETELAARYQAAATELTARGRALPGAADAIAELAADGSFVQSVLTGNLRAVASVKLSAFGLTTHLDMDAGAYGDDDPVRARLVPIAQQRAGTRYHVSFDPATTVIIGDSPSDIEAGRDGGAAVIAVATGTTAIGQLRQAGAVVALEDLRNTGALLAAAHAAASGDAPP
jgi:phosphoglycolate phosphatase